MASAAHRLHLVEYGAETDTATYPVQEANTILDDEGVLRLLLGAADAAQLDRDRGPSVALETTVAGDALAPAKGVTLGLLLAIPLWSLLATLFVLA